MSFRRLIVGGLTLSIERAPFLVRLYRSERYIGFCGGTLLGERTVLTAAHCFDSYNGTVYVGTFQYNIFADTSQETSDVIRVETVHVDPRYSPENIAAGNDVAVLTLSRIPRMFGSPTGPRPIVLGDSSFWPRIVEQPSDSAYVMGYGSQTFQGPQSVYPRVAHVQLYTEGECRALLGFTLSPSNLCAGLPGSDSCSGDSGGPIIVAYNGTFLQVGVISWGLSTSDCGESPGVYSLTGSAYDFLTPYNASFATYTPVIEEGVSDPCACTTNATGSCLSNGFDVSPRCGCADHVGDGTLFCYVLRDECRNAVHSTLFIGALYRECTLPPPPPPTPPPLPPSAPPMTCDDIRRTYRSHACCQTPDVDYCRELKTMYRESQCSPLCRALATVSPARPSP